MGILQFQQGVPSTDIATPDDWRRIALGHAQRVRLVGVDATRFPHDIATLARYGPELRNVGAARNPWSPLPVADALPALSDQTGVHVVADDGGPEPAVPSPAC
jgi:hypothetical protein